MAERPDRLFHFSEDPSLTRFEPHAAPTSAMSEPLVWAIDPAKSYIYLSPRDCPRVTFYAADKTTQEDRERFFSHSTATRIVAIEADWLDRMRATVLYRYEFEPEGFELMDEVAGYRTSRQTVEPVSVDTIEDLLATLAEDGVEVRITPVLWPLYEAVVASTLGFSIVRWRKRGATCLPAGHAD
jgi:hypothetical protein